MADYQASHYALILLYVLLVSIFAHSLFVRGENPGAEWFLVLILPIVVRGVFFLGKGGGARKLGLGLGFSFGAAWTVFTVLSHGLSVGTLVESSIGGSILVATAIGLRWPRVGGALLMSIGLVLAGVFFGGRTYRTAAMLVLMAAVLPLPPFVAGLALFLSGGPGPKDEFADLRETEGAHGG